MDFTKPLRGTLTIPTSKAILSLPISFEGLHEVCVICGRTAHALDTCPNIPKNVFEVIVEKFKATSLQLGIGINPPSTGAPSQLPSETWVTISPKKRSRLPNSHRKRGILSTPSRFDAPKVSIVPPPIITTTIPVSATVNVGGEVAVPPEPFFYPKVINHNDCQAKLSPSPPITLQSGVDIPIDDEDDMDMFLNLEEDEDH